ncbi:MAG: TIR domain-containing protein [Deltaproteobacteria bacterium]|nr:MAG: TIR domain-containing protein [Deltaproteobacteria bacterium]
MVDAIFASYSHRDAAIVDQFEQYARALGNEYLRDSINLRAGEVLSDRLRQMIDQAYAFQLFWSRTLMHSLFVRQEYEYALSATAARSAAGAATSTSPTTAMSRACTPACRCAMAACSSPTSAARTARSSRSTARARSATSRSCCSASNCSASSWRDRLA